MGVTALMIAAAPVATAQIELYGRIVGQLTKSNGQPVAGATVTAVSTDGWRRYTTQTATDGRYVLPQVLGVGGENHYTLEFDPRAVGFLSQWAHRKKTVAEAEVFPVTPGQDTTVDEVLFPTGTLVFTAADIETGAPVDAFCAEALGPWGRRGCTDNGFLTMIELPPGEYSTSVEGTNSNYFDERSSATVIADQTVTVQAKLAPAAMIVTTVLDAATRTPVANTCVQAQSGHGVVGQYPGGCSGPDGRLQIGQLVAGDYRLWAEPGDGRHGAQWVGPDGGTGTRLTAKTVSAAVRQVTSVAPILLDGAGTISGSVVDKETGAPVAGVCAFPRAGHRYDVLPERPSCTKQDGRYTLTGLGPYEWPVHFVDNVASYAWQWSGDQPTQLSAHRVPVEVGQTSTHDSHLVPGTTISGKVTANGVDGDLSVYNAITGDLVASYTFADANGNYRFTNVAGHQLVKVAYRDLSNPPYHEHWYQDASTFRAARSIPVRPGTPTTGIDLVITPR